MLLFFEVKLGMIKNGTNEKIVTKKENIESTEKYMQVSEIRSDTILLKDGGLRWIIKVEWLNLDLKSYEEQLIVIDQYKKFLNSINFPIQVLARSTVLDLSDYILYMRKTVIKIENDVLKWQWEKYVEFLEKMNDAQWLLYTKEFYIVVPYYSYDDMPNMRKSFFTKLMQALSREETAEHIVERMRFYTKNKTNLDSRCQLILDWLRWFGIVSERLHINELVTLLFESYNPLSHRKQAELVGNL